MSTVGRYGVHARLLWRASRAISGLCLLLTVGQALASTAVILLSRRFLDDLTSVVRGGSELEGATWHALAWLALALVSEPALAAVTAAITPALTARYLVLVTDGLAEAGLHPHGIAHLEAPDTASRLQALVQASRDWTFVGGVASTWQILGYRLSGVGAFVVLMTWRWWVPFVLALGWLVLGRAFSAWISTAWDDVLDVAGNERRHASYLRGLLLGDHAAKELRLYGLAGWLTGRYRSTWLTAMRPVWRSRTSAMRPVAAATLLLLLVNGAGFALLAHDAWTGLITVGVLAAMVQAAQQLELFGPIGDIQTALGANTSATAQLVRVRRELGLPGIPARRSDPARGGRHRRRSGAAAPGAGQALGAGTPAEVVLEGVSFCYPSSSAPVLSGLDLRIPAGQSVAVVGANGAGKSTLIKLLCGLYEPTSGRVTVDGRDPCTDDAARRRVAVIFQEFVRYHLSLRDNVRLSDEAVDEVAALADAGGASLLERLDHGWETVLSAGYEGGTDLSGGQWQRVALARAFASLARGAGVLVLDEPTAALDVRAETALFERFLQVTHGMTTVLASHRLSSVRHADRIVVIEHGRITEDGSHEELMARDGSYAAMFRLQAARFGGNGAPYTAHGPAVDGPAPDGPAVEGPAMEGSAAAQRAGDHDGMAAHA